jgi:hypothetical protein
LKKHGLYKGKIDWINGPLTKKAIDEFKEKSLKDNENKIDVNSEFNKALIHTYCAERTISVEEQKSDTDWKKDKNFVNNLLTVLKSFDSKNDMLVLSVNQSKETNNDRKDQSKDDYDNLWAYYEGTNHAISVEKVITDDQENPTIVVSNPWDSGRVYNIKFNELIKKSNAFQLCTKEERNLTQYRWKGNGEWVRRDAASSNIDKVDEAKTVNQIVEITWDVNEKLREARGDIIVENIWENKITVKSYNQTRQVEQSKWKIIIW